MCSVSNTMETKRNWMSFEMNAFPQNSPLCLTYHQLEAGKQSLIKLC